MSIKSSIDLLLSQINKDTPYEQLFDIHIKTNKLKINYIKQKMSELVIERNLLRKFNDVGLPDYLNNILSMLVESYPIMKQHIEKIIFIVKFINDHVIHPIIFQSLLMNLIHTSIIYELINNSNLINDKKFIKQISDIPNNIALSFSIFDDIMITVEKDFKFLDEIIGYNDMSNMSASDFCDIVNNYIENDIIISNSHKLNTYIINIERMTEHIMNDFSSIMFKSITENEINIDKHIEILQKTTTIYEKSIISNMNNINQLNVFADIHIDNLFNLCKKNALYYWINIMASMNSLMFDKLLK